MEIGYIIAICLIGVWLLGTLIKFLKSFLHCLKFNKYPNNESSNICLVLFDAMLWPSDLINCIFCISSTRPRTMAEDEYYFEE